MTSDQVASLSVAPRLPYVPNSRLLGALFFLSGASSLIFETLFTRLLTYTFGNTAYAVSTVLAAFMGGLALGAYGIGRWVDRRRPSIVIYGGLELVVGLYGLFVPLLFAVLTRAYVSLFHALSLGPAGLTAVRSALAILVIIVPSALMGGTLPALARVVAAARPDFQSQLDWLYALNTFGAAAGVLASTYVLMPNWGVHGMIALACSINGAIFLCTALLRESRSPQSLSFSAHETASAISTRRGFAGETPRIDAEESNAAALGTFSDPEVKLRPERESAARAERTRVRAFIPIAAFLAGLIALAYEVIWSHALAFLVGNAVYAFGMMLFTFLCGLGAGAHVVSRLPRRAKTWAWAFAASQLLAGIVVILTLPLWSRVPDLFALGLQRALELDFLAFAFLVLVRLTYLAVRAVQLGASAVDLPRWRRAVIFETILIVMSAVVYAFSLVRVYWFSPDIYFVIAEVLMIYFAIRIGQVGASAARFQRWRKEVMFELILLMTLAAWVTLSSSPAAESAVSLWRYPGTAFVASEAFRFFVAFYLLIIPGFLLGVGFPSLLNLFSHVREKAGTNVGVIYAANTAGSILGSVVTGFVLLQSVGSFKTLRLAAILNIGLALLFLALVVPARRPWKLTAVGAFAAALIGFGAQPSNWDVRNMLRGTYVYFAPGWRIDKVLYLSEDVQGGLTSVVQSGSERLLLTNGKFQGDNVGEVPAQIRFAQMPVLFTRDFERALVIGLGTGNTLQALGAFPFRRIDVVELAPAVVDAARTKFADVNGDILDRDPRAHLSIADGRNFLLLSGEKYDLITIEVSSIWISGEADLYNKEFYALCRSHLTEHGVLQQWVQIHHMRTKDLLVVLNTAAQVFPHAAFFLGPEQGLLIASSSPLEIDYAEINAFDHDPAVRRELDRIGVPSMFSLLEELMLYERSFTTSLKALPELSGLPENFASTDAYPYLEYQTPKGNMLPYYVTLNRRFLEQFRASALPPDLVIRNLQEPTDRDYISGLVFEARRDFPAAIESLNRVKGPNLACAQQEIAWMEPLLHQSSVPAPRARVTPVAHCP